MVKAMAGYLDSATYEGEEGYWRYMAKNELEQKIVKSR